MDECKPLPTMEFGSTALGPEPKGTMSGSACRGRGATRSKSARNQGLALSWATSSNSF